MPRAGCSPHLLLEVQFYWSMAIPSVACWGPRYRQWQYEVAEMETEATNPRRLTVQLFKEKNVLMHIYTSDFFF